MWAVKEDEDGESAESVSIPAGTGEYLDHMNRMASMGSSGNNENGNNGLVPQLVDLNGGGAVGPYNLQQQQQYTPEELYALAEQIAKMQAQQASQQQVQVGGTNSTISHMPQSQVIGVDDDNVIPAGQLVPVTQQFTPYTGQ